MEEMIHTNRIIEILKKEKKKNKEFDINTLKGLIYYIGNILLCFKFNNKFSYCNKGLPNLDISLETKNELLNYIKKIPTKDISNILLGEIYQGIMTKKDKKVLGQIYTPSNIVKEIVNNSIDENKIVKDPYYKIIDPACGGGYFLLESLRRMKNIFNLYKKDILEKNHEIAEEYDKGIENFIIKNNLWGTDIDEFAVFMTKVSLILKLNSVQKINPNVFNVDILLERFYENMNIDSNNKYRCVFDLVIGNPPYIGHKKIDKQYRIQLKKNYSDIYSDKGDISYCFFKKGFDLLKKNGVLSFITSRYFLESPSARDLRIYIKEKFCIKNISDFNGIKVFKDVGISPVIIKLVKKEKKRNEIKIDIYRKSDKLLNKKKFMINYESLNDREWRLITSKESKIYDKIEKKGDTILSQICNFSQGIITGLDKAFVVYKENIENESLEEDVILPWIKNSDILSYGMKDTNKYLIYTNLIKNIDYYPNITKRLLKYKDRLSSRRECERNIRKWYEIQWGRNIEIFKSPKIVFPFKAEANRFTIDYNNVLSSADVYLAKVKEGIEDFSIEYILGYLNSKIFEFYFKVVGKKVGERLYEYYPNKLKTLKIKFTKDSYMVEEKVKDILKYNERIMNKDNIDKYNHLINKNKYYIDTFFYNLYNINDDEVKTIEKYIKY
ncbi:Eco57I restriction-modification methylase domain-containing protein [Clostridiisalibacter paucivorans]|uniref:Eco57I restriction-modification methylase domain-containing protein n=1 Tax=Clostridiisalibacter paucivorans TaxID=408753 RepID=UPI001FDF5333|nr:DNA methyltransferase [Clostridiisalibacter paucivorans]